MGQLDRAEIYRRRAADIAAAAEQELDDVKRDDLRRLQEEWLKLAAFADATLSAQSRAFLNG